MDKLLRALIAGILLVGTILGISYLFISLVAWDINIAHWKEYYRLFLLAVVLVVSFLIAALLNSD